MDEFLGEFLSRELAALPETMRRRPEAVAPREPDRFWEAAPGVPCVVEWVRPELAREFPGVPTRVPGRSSRSWTRGWQTRTFLQKTGRVARGASRWESRHALDVDFDVEAAAMCEQPMAIRMPDGSRHLPDAFVWMRRGPHEIREVKPESDAVEQEGRWSAIGGSVAALGYGYRVVTDTRLAYPPRVANIDAFMSHRHAEVPGDWVLNEMWRALASGPMTVGAFRARFPELATKQLHALVRLVFIGVTDLDRPFDDDSTIVRQRRDIRRVGAAFRSDCRPAGPEGEGGMGAERFVVGQPLLVNGVPVVLRRGAGNDATKWEVRDRNGDRVRLLSGRDLSEAWERGELLYDRNGGTPVRGGEETR
ncbi:hypothetical protein [Aureimonas sp. ME7]|uniref:hypothetical protein n=1 Tax=Aureimonas sp. ME7 TaxID=2744252 RepID=UPI0015F6AB7A|nr:hypothetical protein [Aureimonas sp. ME7]